MECVCSSAGRYVACGIVPRTAETGSSECWSKRECHVRLYYIAFFYQTSKGAKKIKLHIGLVSVIHAQQVFHDTCAFAIGVILLLN